MLDRRIIFIFVALAIGTPIAFRYSLTPARMESAENYYDAIDALKPEKGKIAFVAFDFGPNTKAENEAQAQVVLEHLMRKRIPTLVFTLYPLAEPFLKSVPQQIADRLAVETGEVWEYGADWVNLGYQPGGRLIIQSIPKADTLAGLFKTDVRGNRLSDLRLFEGVGGLEDIVFLSEFTGLVGIFDLYIEFFQRKDHRPEFGHGCTSITIPEAFIFLDSGQLIGLLEGVAGAAWYSELLSRNFPARAPDNSKIINSALGVAHLVIIFFVILGNLALFRNWWRARGA